MRFSHTVQTTASAKDVWRIWTDIERWPEWDSELASAELRGSFRLGAVGHLVSKQGVQSRFLISQLVDNTHADARSYTFTVQLPLCRLHVHRFFSYAQRSPAGKILCFTHEVSFRGVTSFFFGWLLGRQFRRVLPTVMQSVKALAESESVVRK